LRPTYRRWSSGFGKHAHFSLSTPPTTRAWQAMPSPFQIGSSFAQRTSTTHERLHLIFGLYLGSFESS
jgi:hypothetical protein